MLENIDKNIVQRNEENNNNTLSIIDESQSKEKTLQIKSQIQNENLPIKTKKFFKTAEEYYSYNYPEYKLFRKGNILFCQMGKLITFNFDENQNFRPKFSIGPNWYMTLTLISIIILISFILYFIMFIYLHFIYRIIFIILFFLIIFSISRASLIHTEIAMNKIQDSLNNSYCYKCKIYYNDLDKVEHCDTCKVCFLKYDHHCVWVGKCVGKDNFKAFSHMIFFGGIFYLYLIACVIMYNKK